MIGNDIVDLAFARRETNWQRPGFVEKVFDHRELQYLQSSVAPEALVWRLWSMKESAYKAHVRKTSRRFFNPKTIHCSLLDARHGRVLIGDRYYKTITNSNSNYLYTIASSSTVSSLESSCFMLSEANYATQYQETRKKVYQRMAELLDLPQVAIAIKKEGNGVPAIYAENQLLRTKLTITHHGKYGAFALSNYDL